MSTVAPPTFNPQIFRAYDIRGVVGEDLTRAGMVQIARAYATYLGQLGTIGGASRVVVTRDGRPSSPSLYEAAIEGLRAAGIDVVAIGAAPTPLAGFAAFTWEAAGALAVTGSHNPPQFNGAKLLRAQAMPLLPDEIQAIRRIAEASTFLSGEGALTERDPAPEYLAMLASRFQLPEKARPLRVIADPGNGVATLTGPAALRSIGAEVVTLHADLLEGSPNRPSDPQHPEALAPLAAQVAAQGADLGVAWDGDGDRIGVVDEQGQRHEPDRITAVLARDVLTRHPGARIFMDLKSSLSAIEDVRAHGGIPVLSRTGYSLFRRQMREERVIFGGEASGHVIFGEDYPYIDDGVYAACALASVVARSGVPLSQHFIDMRSLVTSAEIILPCDDVAKFRIALAIAEHFRPTHAVLDIDGARVTFQDPNGSEGWALLRASNTMPCLSVRFEAETPALYAIIRRQIRHALQLHAEILLPEDFGEPLSS